MLIEDGTGKGYKAKVNIENMLRVYAQVESELSHVSESHGDAYVWTAAADWGADKNAIWLRNDSTTQNLIVDQLILTVAAAAVVEIWVGTGSTSAGTAVTGTNLNVGSGNSADATCKHTNTNLDSGGSLTLLMTLQLAATDPTPINFLNSLILDYYDEVAIVIVTDVGSSSVNIIGYFHEPA